MENNLNRNTKESNEIKKESDIKDISSNPEKAKLNQHFEISFKIKEDDNIAGIISIEENNKIKEVKDKIIKKISRKIEPKYAQIYKNNQLLDENNTVSFYGIKPSDTLVIKSSRQGEFLVFFSGEKGKVIGKYVTKNDNIKQVFRTLFYIFYDHSSDLIFDSITINDNATFGDLNIQENDKIIVKGPHRLG